MRHVSALSEKFSLNLSTEEGCTIMNQQPKLNYPESWTELFSGHYLDLLLNAGAMKLSYKDNIPNSKDQNELSELLHDANICTEEDNSEPPASPEQGPSINKGSREWTWTPEILPTPTVDTEECIAGIKGTTGEDIILHGPLSEDIKMRKAANDPNEIGKLSLDKEDSVDYDPEWKERSVDYDPTLSCYDDQ